MQDLSRGGLVSDHANARPPRAIDGWSMSGWTPCLKACPDQWSLVASCARNAALQVLWTSCRTGMTG